MAKWVNLLDNIYTVWILDEVQTPGSSDGLWVSHEKKIQHKKKNINNKQDVCHKQNTMAFLTNNFFCKYKFAWLNLYYLHWFDIHKS